MYAALATGEAALDAAEATEAEPDLIADEPAEATEDATEAAAEVADL